MNKDCPICGWESEYHPSDTCSCSNLECFLHDFFIPALAWNTRPASKPGEGDHDLTISALEQTRLERDHERRENARLRDEVALLKRAKPGEGVEALKAISRKKYDPKPGHYCEARSALDGAIKLADNALEALRTNPAPQGSDPETTGQIMDGPQNPIAPQGSGQHCQVHRNPAQGLVAGCLKCMTIIQTPAPQGSKAPWKCRECGREGKPGDWSECFTVCDVCWPVEAPQGSKEEKP